LRYGTVAVATFSVLSLLTFGVLTPMPAPPRNLNATGVGTPVPPVGHPASVTVLEWADALTVEPVPGVSRGWSVMGAVAATSDSRAPDAVAVAYTQAAALAPSSCHITASLLAAIGQVESGNLAGHGLDSQNRVTPEILGPPLDGSPFQAIKDTDQGLWDGDRRWDRALGPMQLIPSSWRIVGVDIDDDGVRDPQDLDDAAGAAMLYLCAGGRDLTTPTGLRDAVLSYNPSMAYLQLVLKWKTVFDATASEWWLTTSLTAFGTELGTEPAKPEGRSLLLRPNPTLLTTPRTPANSSANGAGNTPGVPTTPPAPVDTDSPTLSPTSPKPGSVTPPAALPSKPPAPSQPPAPTAESATTPTNEPTPEPSCLADPTPLDPTLAPTPATDAVLSPPVECPPLAVPEAPAVGEPVAPSG
jgi:hypothetical protein